MNKKFIVANWKMKPETLAEAEEIVEAANEALSGDDAKKSELTVVFCPPFVFMEEVAKMLSLSHLQDAAFLGAQDIASQDTGAFTGEVSGPMLRSLNTQYVIVGHSERRWKLGEDDAKVNEKLKAVLRNGLTPIVCLGERYREEGWQKKLKEQTERTFSGVSTDNIKKCFIAYEPVWAISTTPGAKPDTPKSAIESLRLIHGVIIGNWKLEIRNLPKALYGGSITSKNAKEFLEKNEFSGVLVGSASVKKEEFVNILKIANAL